jgi:hypothetical protein
MYTKREPSTAAITRRHISKVHMDPLKTAPKRHRAMRKWYAALWRQDSPGIEVTALQEVDIQYVILLYPVFQVNKA